nr:DUF2802 domain-containing protein [Legionella brunensis]
MLFLSLFFFSVIRRYQKSLEELKQHIQGITQELKQLQRSYTVLVNADLGFAKQAAEINRQLVSMDNQLQALENKRDNDGGYQHALRILEMGGDKEEIINSCHLSNAEAELLMNLNAYRTVLRTNPNLTNI